MKLRLLTPFAPLIFVAACGGGSTGPSALSFAEVDDLAQQIQNQFGDDFENDNFTPLDTLPVNGGGSYSGLVGFGSLSVENTSNIDASNATVVGELNLEVDFGEDEISGDAENFFVTETEEELTGTLDVELTLDRSVDIENTFSLRGSMTGALTDEAGDVGDIDFDLAGDFFRDDRSAIFGDIDGSITFDGDVIDDIDGIFVATRD